MLGRSRELNVFSNSMFLAPLDEVNTSRTSKFAPVKSLRFSELILGILLSEFRFTVFFPLGCGAFLWAEGFMISPPSDFSNHERKSPQRGLGRSLEQCRYPYNFSAPS